MATPNVSPSPSLASPSQMNVAAGAASDRSRTKVVCRFRPQNKNELELGGKVNMIMDGDDTLHFEVRRAHNRQKRRLIIFYFAQHSKGRQTFSFDRIFGIDSHQHEVFDYSARPVVEDVMKGYNGTIFAYGQTGSGKTFSMQGPDITDAKLKGIIPRIVETVFDEIGRASDVIEFTVCVSYMEIYLEKIRDLLDRAHAYYLLLG